MKQRDDKNNIYEKYRTTCKSENKNTFKCFTNEQFSSFSVETDEKPTLWAPRPEAIKHPEEARPGEAGGEALGRTTPSAIRLPP